MIKNAYEVKNYERLFGTPGFSDKMLKNHFKLYEGYVNNTNELINRLALAARSEEAKDPQNVEMRRRFGWEFNGMRLHEYYFENMGKETAPLPRNSGLSKRISETFVSFENWKKEFTGTGAMRGIGWAALVYDRAGERLLNIWINEHDAGHLAGAEILLIMDVFEHAFTIDYGIDKPKYIESFWNAVQWAEVQKRYDACKKRTSEAKKEEAACYGPSQ